MNCGFIAAGCEAGGGGGCGLLLPGMVAEKEGYAEYLITPTSDAAIILESGVVGLENDPRPNNFMGPLMGFPPMLTPTLVVLTLTPPPEDGLLGTVYVTGALEGPAFPLLDGRLAYKDGGRGPMLTPSEEYNILE